MEARLPGVKWYVFSEDEAWCRAHLGFLAGAQFVRFDSSHAEIEEMYLMKHCGGGVIAIVRSHGGGRRWEIVPGGR